MSSLAAWELMMGRRDVKLHRRRGAVGSFCRDRGTEGGDEFPIA